MKHLYRELTVMAAAAVLCAALASRTALADDREQSTSTVLRETAVSALSAEAIASNMTENRMAEELRLAAAEKTEAGAWDEAEKKLEKITEAEEKKAAKKTEKKAKEEAAEKEAGKAAEKIVSEAAEQAAKEQAELETLGLTSDARVRVTAEELDLLAAIIYCEAGGEEMNGKVAVGAVVLNRVLSTSFENSIEEVIYAPGQFTPAMTGLLDQVRAGEINEECYIAARAALNGENPVGDCLYFNSGAGQGIQIGNQHFY